MTLTFGSWCCTVLFRLWTMGILSCPLFQNGYWSSNKENLKAWDSSFMDPRGPLCWGGCLVQVARCAAAGWALGDGSPEKSLWTAKPLHNKGLRDLWLSQVRDTQGRDDLQPPELFDWDGIKAQCFPPWRHPLQAVILLFYHNYIILRIQTSETLL